jgi:hypothetical protein
MSCFYTCVYEPKFAVRLFVERGSTRNYDLSIPILTIKSVEII